MLQCDLTRLLQDLLSHNPKSCSGRCETVTQYRHQRLISGDFTSVYNFVNTHAYVCAQLQIPDLTTSDLGIWFKWDLGQLNWGDHRSTTLGLGFWFKLIMLWFKPQSALDYFFIAGYELAHERKIEWLWDECVWVLPNLGHEPSCLPRLNAHTQFWTLIGVRGGWVNKIYQKRCRLSAPQTTGPLGLFQYIKNFYSS